MLALISQKLADSNRRIRDAELHSFIIIVYTHRSSTISSLYHHKGSEGYHFPDSFSVFITCILVSFFPSLDAASSMKKAIERMLGTVVGAAAAIILGFISILIGPGTKGQAAFLGAMLAILFFALPYYFFKTRQFGYAQLLGSITFGFVSLVFYNAIPNAQSWRLGCERTAALLVGCLVSLIVSAVVFPKPVEDIIRMEMNTSMRNMGKAVRLLLDPEEGGHKLPLISELLEDDEKYERDEIYNTYVAAANKFQATKTKLALLKYDPFLLWSRGFDKEKIALYAKEVRLQGVRLNRLITSIISMDSLYRSGIQEVDMAKYNLSDALAETGKRVEVVLDMKDNTKGGGEDRSEAARLLLENMAYIHQVRNTIEVEAARKDDEEFMKNIDSLLKQQKPRTIYSDEDALCFFLRHVELTIMRCIRLHYCFEGRVSSDDEDVGGEEVDECVA